MVNRGQILDQLAGAPGGMGQGRLKAMTGASGFVAIENGIGFRFKGCRKYKGVNIELNESDLYDMTLFAMTGTKVTIDTFNNLHAEDLTDTFTRETGLDVNL